MELRTHENGNICCSSIDPKTGKHTMSKHPCDKCKHHFAHQRQEFRAAAANGLDEYAPPDPYEAPLAALRAAAATAKSRFAEEWKTKRMRELLAEPQPEFRAAQPPLTPTELATYEPPD